jgi:hypothetical protein
MATKPRSKQPAPVLDSDPPGGEVDVASAVPMPEPVPAPVPDPAPGEEPFPCPVLAWEGFALFDPAAHPDRVAAYWYTMPFDYVVLAGHGQPVLVRGGLFEGARVNAVDLAVDREHRQHLAMRFTGTDMRPVFLGEFGGWVLKARDHVTATFGGNGTVEGGVE